MFTFQICIKLSKVIKMSPALAGLRKFICFYFLKKIDLSACFVAERRNSTTLVTLVIGFYLLLKFLCLFKGSLDRCLKNVLCTSQGRCMVYIKNEANYEQME